MQCREFDQYLEQGMDYPLAREAKAHLDDCGRCRGLVSDLEAITATGRELASEDVAPPEDIWVPLRTQLEAEGLIRAPAWLEPRADWLVRWLHIALRPALAGASLTVLLAAAVLVGYLSYQRRNQAAETAQAPLLAASLDKELAAVADHAVSATHEYDSAVAASLRENLQIVDNIIASCEENAREAPQSELAREYLYGAYQQKANLLAMMTDRSVEGH